jgi:outer membrane protein assembly factor BamB/predicted phosphohydrolase
MRSIFVIFLFYILNQANLFPQNITFSWMSDLHIGGSTTAKTNLIESVENINKNELNEFTIISGDIVESGKLSDLELAKEILSKLKKPYYIIPGNHELKWSGSAGKDFCNVFGDDKFHFKHKGFHFIGLHQGPVLRMADGIFSPEILRWLKNEMKEIKKDEPIIAVFHYPLDSSVSNWYECYDILKNYNVVVILVGHGHKNADLNFNGIHGVMGRSNLEKGQISSGYNIVKINKDTISFYHKTNVIEKDSLWNRFILTAPKSELLNKKYPLLSTNDNYPDIKIKWMYNAGYTITSAPQVIGNNVVISSGEGITILNKKTGEVKWQYKTEDAVYSTPAIYKNNIIFTSKDGYLYSVDFVNKKLLWKFFCEVASVATPNVEVEGKRVYVGSSSGNFYCIDATNGKLVWKYSDVDGYVEAKPSIYKNKIVFAAWDNYLYCLNKNSGELLWKWSNGKNNILYSPAVCTPVIKDDKVFIVAPDRYLSMIDLNTGETLFRTNKYAVREAIGISEDSILILSKSMYDTAFACRVTDNVLSYEWATKLDYEYDFAPSYPVEESGTIYFGTKTGFVYALDSKDGSMKWKYKLNDCLVNDICPISDKSLIISTLNGMVYYLYDVKK